MGPREELRAAERGILRAMGVGEYQGTQGSCEPPWRGGSVLQSVSLRAFQRSSILREIRLFGVRFLKGVVLAFLLFFIF